MPTLDAASFFASSRDLSKRVKKKRVEEDFNEEGDAETQNNFAGSDLD